MKYTMMKRCLMWLLLVFIAAGLFGCDSKEEEPESAKEGAAQEQALATRPDEADPNDWCGGHGVPESMCTKCHSELVDKYKEAGDWCAAHGFPESVCPKCNPMDPPGAAKSGAANADEHSADNGEWCAGHGVPESHCTKCHPELIDKFKEAGDWCAEHGFPESKCPKCNPQTPPGGIAQIPGVEPGTQIIFKRSDHEDAVGIEATPVRKVPVGLGTRAPARIEFDRNQLADVRAAVPGIVRDVLVDLGQEVDQGTPLFVLESAQVGEVQAKVRAASEELKTARANLERQEKLFEKGLSAERKVEVAQRDFEEAKAKVGSLRSSLRLAGGSGGSSTGRYTIRAPIAGTIVERPGVVGAFATAETSLATVADTSKMWAMLDVAEEDSSSLENGQPVTLSVDGATGHEFKGKVTWISPQVDSRTRTVKVRAEIANPGGKLRANQFARAEVGIAPDHKGVVVPKEAIQSLNGGTVVFVRKKQGQYEPRVVDTGRSDGDIVQVRGNLKVGEPVVTTGAFVLKTELSRDSIGAGCCEVPEE